MIRYNDGNLYEGEVKKGTEIKHGRGFIISETLYEGYWRNNNPHVKGLLIRQDGTYSLREYRDGKFYGESIDKTKNKIGRYLALEDGSVY